MNGLVALSSMAIKRCPQCKKSLYIREFSRNRARYDGVDAYCRKCKYAYMAVYRNKNNKRFMKYRNNPQSKRKHLEGLRKVSLRLKVEFLKQYGEECRCCGETEVVFLTIEHSRGNGKVHRKSVGNSLQIIRDLRKRGWPKDEGIEVLCWNCNTATRYNHRCPHALSRV